MNEAPSVQRAPGLRLETRVDLPASADEVWNLVADVGGWHRWTRLLGAVRVPRSVPSAGDSLVIESRMMSFGRALRIPIVVEDAVPARSFGWRGKVLGIDGRHGFVIEPLADERCRVTQWEELFGWQCGWIRRLGMWAALERSFRALFAELRAHLAKRAIPTRLDSVELDGATMRFVEVGAGPSTVLLHGYPQNHRCWRHQIAALRSTRRLIVPDLLGWGASDRSLDLDYRYDAEVARLERFIELVARGAVDLVAHDYGGYLALGLAKRRPDLVRSLVVLNSRAHGSFKALWRLAFVASLKWIGKLPWARWLPVRWLHARGLRRERRLGAFDANAEDDYLGAFVAGGPANAWLFRFFADYDFTPRATLVDGLASTMRTLVIWGADDAYLSIDIADQLAAALPRCTFVRLDGRGHYVMEEAPDAVTEALVDFWARD